MRIAYFSETDMLSISFRDQPSIESEEVAPGFVLDFGADGHVVGLEIEHASQRVNIEGVSVSELNILS
ncbi:MAG: hypothetical protein FD129_1312 [bacterium]|nr:MAG: hypothetical protein FD129_1312 [bacterium]